MKPRDWPSQKDDPPMKFKDVRELENAGVFASKHREEKQLWKPGIFPNPNTASTIRMEKLCKRYSSHH